MSFLFVCSLLLSLFRTPGPGSKLSATKDEFLQIREGHNREITTTGC